MTIEILIPVIVALFTSQGFWAWLMNRNSQSKQILNEVKSLRADFDREKAITARARILRFNDELLNNAKHSKESFDQALSDTDDYEAYCRSHPDFANNRTALSVEHIKRVYQRCEEEHTFL